VPLEPFWLVDLEDKDPDHLEVAADLPFIAVSEAPEPKAWLDFAVLALGFGGQPAIKMTWRLQMFYTVCISVCWLGTFDCLIPAAVPFLPFLWDLLRSAVSEDSRFVSRLFDLLLRYADMCYRDDDAADCWLQAFGNDHTM
jgi:hypothetical protein